MVFKYFVLISNMLMIKLNSKLGKTCGLQTQTLNHVSLKLKDKMQKIF